MIEEYKRSWRKKGWFGANPGYSLRSKLSNGLLAGFASKQKFENKRWKVLTKVEQL